MPEFGFDDWIDAQLRSVPVPPNLLERLAEAGARPHPADVQIEAALRNVTVPVNLQSRLRRIARRGGVTPFWRQVATAASLFIAVGLAGIGYVGVITGAFDSDRQVARVDKSLPTQSPAARQQNNADGQFAARPAVDRTPDKIAAPRVAAASAGGPTDETHDLKGIVAKNAVVPPPIIAPSAIVRTEETAKAQSPEQVALGASGTFDRVPDLDAFEMARPNGVAPPKDRGYDLLFQLKNGEHPFVALANNDGLASTRLPFTFRTASFDAAADALAAGQLPPPDEIRVEDFLAAQESSLPEPPPAGLALHYAGSPSPLVNNPSAMSGVQARQDQLHLLQLAIQAASYDPHERYPNWLIVAVDASSQMRSGARMAAVRRALSKLADHMRDGDRVTLVRFADEPRILAEKISAAQLDKLVASDALLAPAGSPDIVEGIHAAWEIARDTRTLNPRHVVVITADGGNFDPQAVAPAGEQLAQLAAMNIPWRIVRLAAVENDLHWSELTDRSNGKGKIVPAGCGDEIYASMIEALTNWPTLVADDVTVTVKFNPREVTGYRLIGHEATTLTGLSPDPVVVDLGPDQVAKGLFEVTIKPGTGKLIASVEINWRHPPTGQMARIVRPILREELAQSFAQAPAWFQEGVIAAKGAEFLRGSHYAPTARPMRQLLDLASKVDQGLANEADFHRLVELLKQADKLR
jgi:Ca-activated chloride channel family protein